jgi:hypothetical protein
MATMMARLRWRWQLDPANAQSPKVKVEVKVKVKDKLISMLQSLPQRPVLRQINNEKMGCGPMGGIKNSSVAEYLRAPSSQRL